MDRNPRTGKEIGRTEKGRLSQKEDKFKEDQKKKQGKILSEKREILDEKRNPTEEDPSTMKQPSILQTAVKMVVNINRISRKDRVDQIDEIIQQQGKDSEIETGLQRVTSTPTRKFNDLDQALEFINTTVGIVNAGEYIKDKLEANEVLERVLSRTSSTTLSRTSSTTLSRTGSILPEVEFTSSLTNKEYKNQEEFGFFDDLFRFSLNTYCYIIYDLKKDGSVYIEMISCKQYDNKYNKKRSVKGSGRVMMHDLLDFLKNNKISGYPEHNDETIVCLTPEPLVGRAEHNHPQKLYNYYQEMGFEKDEEDRYCGKIGTIMGKINTIVGINDETKKEELTSLGLLGNTEEYADYGGGRRKHTRKKRRKTRKSRKSRRRR